MPFVCPTMRSKPTPVRKLCPTSSSCKKRDRPVEIELDWVHLGKNDDGFAINQYFIDNPEMVLGRQTSESTQYGRQDFTVEPYEDLDLGVQLKQHRPRKK